MFLGKIERLARSMVTSRESSECHADFIGQNPQIHLRKLTHNTFVTNRDPEN